MNNEYTFKANVTRYLCLLTFLLQIVILALGTLVFVPEGKEANLTVCLLLVIPLLLFSPFIILRHLKAHAWLGFLTMGYFFIATMSVFDARYGLIVQIEFFNSILLFTSSMMFTRYEQRRLGISITR
jgi:uncharacterized membrane protein